VEPRTSAKSMDISTSAPPGNWREATSHMLQKRGFKTERCLPNNARTTLPPTPRKGALQNLQRGSRGSIRNNRRRRLSVSNALVVNQNHHTLPTSMDVLSLIFAANLYISKVAQPPSEGILPHCEDEVMRYAHGAASRAAGRSPAATAAQPPA